MDMAPDENGGERWRDDAWAGQVLRGIAKTLERHPMRGLELMDLEAVEATYRGHWFNVDDVLWALGRAADVVEGTVPALAAPVVEFHYDVELHAARSLAGAKRRGEIFRAHTDGASFEGQWRTSDTFVLPGSFTTLLRMHRRVGHGVETWEQGRDLLLDHPWVRAATRPPQADLSDAEMRKGASAAAHAYAEAAGELARLWAIVKPLGNYGVDLPRAELAEIAEALRVF